MMHTKKFQKFLEEGRRIVAEHRAEYKGVYYMKGGILGTIEDIALPAAGFLLGGPLGAAAGSAGASALNGGSIGQDLLAGAVGGLGTSVDVGEALGLGGSIGGSIGNAASDAIGGVGDALGIGNPLSGISDAVSGIGDSLGLGSSSSGSGAGAIDSSTGLPVGQESTNAAGATVNSSTGATVAAPSSTSSITPVSGGGSVGAGDLGGFESNQIGANLGGGTASGAATSASPGLGSITSGASADTALGSATPDAIGSTGSGLDSGDQSFLDSAKSAAQNIGLPTGSSGSSNNNSSSSGGFLNGLESSLGKEALPLAGLAYQAIKGPSQLPSQASALETGGAATAPLLSLENQGATEASTGQLTPTQEANVQQYVQSQQNQLIQQLASEGVTNPTQDSRYISGLQQIQNNALQLQQQYITQAIQEATSAGGAASGNIATVANEQIQNDADYQNALAAAFGALGGFAGGNSQQKAA